MQQRGTLRSAACCGWLILAWVVCARGGCVYPRQELAYCDMVDYKVYDTLDVPEAQKKASRVRVGCTSRRRTDPSNATMFGTPWTGQ